MKLLSLMLIGSLTILFASALIAGEDDGSANGESKTENIRQSFIQGCLEDESCYQRNREHLGKKVKGFREYREGTTTYLEVIAVKSGLGASSGEE